MSTQGWELLSTMAQLLLLPVGLACDKAEGRGLHSSVSLAMAAWVIA